MKKSETREEREARLAYHRDYGKKNRKKLTEQGRQYQKDNALHIALRRKGLTLSECSEAILAHSGLCDICGREPDGRWKKLNIDHCHKTGRFRGMLCTRCNKGLGYFHDNPDLLRKSAHYLERSSS